MKLRNLTSTCIKSVAYKAKVLVIVFQNGGTYVFAGVPAWLYASLFRANSAGRWFRKHILGRFQSLRVA